MIPKRSDADLTRPLVDFTVIVTLMLFVLRSLLAVLRCMPRQDQYLVDKGPDVSFVTALEV